MKILLTGSTGFLGQNLLPVLQQDYEAIGFKSADYDLRFPHDSSSLLNYIRPDVVIHASMKAKISKFILLGTVCAYPKHTPVPFKEEDLWNGYPEETNAPYGIAKKTLMRLLEAYCEQYGMNGVNLIPVNMYGPHDHFNLTSSHVIPALILKVDQAIKESNKSITLWGTGQASREFLYAPDCAEAIKLSIEKDISPDPINIGTGKEIKICELIETIADIMGFDGIINYDDSKPDGQPRRCLDTSKAKGLLGFEAKTTLRQGLINTIKWFKSSSNEDLYWKDFSDDLLSELGIDNSDK